MIMIYDDATLDAAQLDSTIRDLIESIATKARAADLWHLTCIVIVLHNDTPSEFE